MNQQAIAAPGFAPLFTPKLLTVLREGYGAAELRADALAGLTVAIVALPLSMAIAIASGASPAQGLYTAIIGGFLVSALSGSRHQIGGPAGALEAQAEAVAAVLFDSRPGGISSSAWRSICDAAAPADAGSADPAARDWAFP